MWEVPSVQPFVSSFLSQPIQGAVTQIPQTGWLEQQTFISCPSVGSRSEIKVLTNLVSDETHGTKRERALGPHYKALIPFTRAHP